MITKGSYRCLTRFIVLDHVDGCFETLLVHRWGEGGRVVKANEDTDVEEILFGDAKVVHDIPFGDVVEGWFGCQEVDGNHEFIDARVKEGIGWAVDCMDVRFRVALEVNQLRDATRRQTVRKRAANGLHSPEPTPNTERR